MAGAGVRVNSEAHRVVPDWAAGSSGSGTMMMALLLSEESAASSAARGAWPGRSRSSAVKRPFASNCRLRAGIVRSNRTRRCSHRHLHRTCEMLRGSAARAENHTLVSKFSQMT